MGFSIPALQAEQTFRVRGKAASSNQLSPRVTQGNQRGIQGGTAATGEGWNNPSPIKIPGVTFLCSLAAGDTFAQGPRRLQRGWAARDPPCPQTEMLVLAGCGSLPRSSELAVRPLALN